MKRVIVLLITILVIVALISCGTEKPVNDIVINDIEEASVELTGDIYKTEEEVSLHKRSDLLPNTYKIPSVEVYVDTPDFNDIGSGYTELFKDGENKYVTVTYLMDVDIETEKEAFESIYPKFKNNVKSWHRINQETFTSTELVEINGISAQKVIGTVEYGALDKYDCYLYGYGFIFEGVPCAIIGVVSDLDQPQEEIDELTAIVDAMMESVRNEQ